MSSYKIVYTTSFEPHMISDLTDSILSTREFVDKEDIIVIFTPPIGEKDIISEISKIASIEIKDRNIGKSFALHPKDPTNPIKHYGDKIFLTDIDSPNLLFLDCDTYIYNNPSKLFEGDFDFGGIATDLLPEQWQYKSNIQKITRNTFNLYNEDFHIWDGGSLVFKNNTHKLIKDKWIDIFNNRGDEMEYCMKENRKTYDQTSLVPALYGYNLRYRIYNSNEIRKVRGNWNKEDIPEDIIILHGNNIKQILDGTYV